MEMNILRAALVSAALLLAGCDNASTSTSPTQTATVLEGKTMGTFWRVSVVDIDKKRADELREKIQTQLDGDDQLLSTWKNDSALMRFNLSSSTAPWPVTEAMADIVTESLRIGQKPRVRWM